MDTYKVKPEKYWLAMPVLLYLFCKVILNVKVLLNSDVNMPVQCDPLHYWSLLKMLQKSISPFKKSTVKWPTTTLHTLLLRWKRRKESKSLWIAHNWSHMSIQNDEFIFTHWRCLFAMTVWSQVKRLTLFSTRFHYFRKWNM